MTEISAQIRQLRDVLSGIRVNAIQAVSDGGIDAHQVDVDRFVWSYAHSEAAIALGEWAESTRDPYALRIADIAIRYALSKMKPELATETNRLAVDLATLVGSFEPTEDLGATADHRILRSTIRAFASRHIRPHARQIHRDNLDIPESIISGAAELGLFGLSIPLEYGGSQDGEDFLAMLIVTEELARASLAAGGSLITRPEILVRALLRAGTEDQKRRWLPAIASGQKLIAVAVTEPDYGSDVGAIQCRATLVDGNWEIDGTKLWSTFAGRAELVTVLCRTADTGHRGLSLFVVDKPAFPGLAFEHRQAGGGTLNGRAIPTIGYRGMHTFELAFDRYRVPASALVGGDQWLNRGFYLQMEGFAMGRIQTAGRAVGLMHAAVEDSIRYGNQRTTFGKPILANQLIRSKVGRMILQLNASRQLSYRAARLLNVGRGQTEASLAKLYASRACEAVTRNAMQVHGAIGYSEETDVSRYFLDARVLSIFEGTEEVLALRVVGKALLEATD